MPQCTLSFSLTFVCKTTTFSFVKMLVILVLSCFFLSFLPNSSTPLSSLPFKANETVLFFLQLCWGSSCSLFLKTFVVAQYTGHETCPPLFSACFQYTHVARQCFSAFHLHSSSSSPAETLSPFPLCQPLGAIILSSVFMNLAPLLLFSL